MGYFGLPSKACGPCRARRIKVSQPVLLLILALSLSWLLHMQSQRSEIIYTYIHTNEPPTYSLLVRFVQAIMQAMQAKPTRLFRVPQPHRSLIPRPDKRRSSQGIAS